jgi:chromosome segregation ATPase
LQSENKTLNGEAERSRDRIAQLLSDITELRRDNSELLQLQEELAEAQTKLAKSRRKNAKLAAQVSDRVELQRQVQELSDENERLLQEFSQVSDEVASSPDENVEDVAALKESLDAALQRNNGLQQLVDVLTEQNAQFRKSLSEETSSLLSGSPSRSPRKVGSPQRPSRRSRSSNDEANRTPPSSPQRSSSKVKSSGKEVSLSRSGDDELDEDSRVSPSQIQETEDGSENQRLRARLARLQKIVKTLNEPRNAYARILSENEELVSENAHLKDIVASIRGTGSTSLDI